MHGWGSCPISFFFESSAFHSGNYTFTVAFALRSVSRRASSKTRNPRDQQAQVARLMTSCFVLLACFLPASGELEDLVHRLVSIAVEPCR